MRKLIEWFKYKTAKKLLAVAPKIEPPPPPVVKYPTGMANMPHLHSTHCRKCGEWMMHNPEFEWAFDGMCSGCNPGWMERISAKLKADRLKQL